MNADAGHYGVQLAAEVLALRDSMEGWQFDGRPCAWPPFGSVEPSRSAPVSLTVQMICRPYVLTHARDLGGNLVCRCGCRHGC